MGINRTSYSLYLAIFLAVSVAACASITPAENFRRGLDSYIGHDVSSDPYYGFASPENLQETRKLENGNDMRVYFLRLSQGDCLYGLEIKSGTNVVSGWRILQDSGGCRIVP